ncbi:MAG: carbohydrate kinase family protein, partial [Sedimentisphaerales bacterium]|nr:carbohydrate kinase family protein [Sedimentisphaerales bacterium]
MRAKYELTDWPKVESGKAIALPFGEKISVDEVFSTIGGNAANAAVTFARYGFKTACLAKIGDDPAGREFVGQLEKLGVSSKLIVKAAGKQTAYSAILLGNGERTILSHHGASDSFSMADVDLGKLKAKWWYISLSGESDAMFVPLLNFALEHNIKVAFNPSGYHIKNRKQEILDNLKHLAFLVLNAEEAADLVGIPFEKHEEVFA